MYQVTMNQDKARPSALGSWLGPGLGEEMLYYELNYIIIIIIVISLECGERWYEHQPIPVIENEQVKLMWDNTIITDRRVPNNRPDITLVLKDRHKWVMVDVAVLDDRYIVTTEAWKIEWYQDLAFEVKRMHQVVVVPLVIGALGTVLEDFAKWQEYLGIPDITGSAQMSALLGTAHTVSSGRCCISKLREGAEM